MATASAAALGHPSLSLSLPFPQATGSPFALTTLTDPHRAGAPRTEPRRGLGAADGAVPDGTTVADDGVPGVANLDPDLRAALRGAAEQAAVDGVRLLVNSGWRSRDYQAGLLRDAIATYGSGAEAARWVADPDTSAHVSGDAVDVGPAAAATWLADHGGAYGLCRTYANEPWHFELRTDASEGGCPSSYADAAHDPRSRR
ncbi:tail length tape measure protein [Paraconexibacter sp. AEG42_29]|uniref:Tail length tape measure protein n=1 Tax=Paraconexibacter sp. AEG42_29 TaxID=2997339 RepID=A0AAU7AYL3_9ACTN